MNREKFLKELEECLAELEDDEKRSVISFYSDYFNKQMSMGRTEEDIIDELGNPRFLAKSIKDNYQSTGDASAFHRFNESQQFKSTTINIDRWYFKLIAAVIAILTILLVMAILAGILTIFLKIVVPVLIILIIVSVIRNIFNR